jgi:hypothetical protein
MNDFLVLKVVRLLQGWEDSDHFSVHLSIQLSNGSNLSNNTNLINKWQAWKFVLVLLVNKDNWSSNLLREELFELVIDIQTVVMQRSLLVLEVILEKLRRRGW